MKKKEPALQGTLTTIIWITASILATALVMIWLPEPTFKPNSYPKMEISDLKKTGLSLEQVYVSEPVKFQMRDGKQLFSQHFPKESNLTIIILHGILANSNEFNKTSGMLRESVNADVYALDLRGHGQSDGEPGDIDYIHQYADDVADVVGIIKKQKPNGKIILMGHSMGGGIAQEFAMKKDKPEIDGYLLFAPAMDWESPTNSKKEKSGSSSEPFAKIHLSRILGLLSLNAVGITWFNGLNTLFFNLPPEMPIHQYTFRAMVSMSPSNYKEGLNAINKPLLLIVGSNDQAFVADQFEPVVSENVSDGKVIVIEGQTHDGVHHDERSIAAVKEWIDHL